MSIGFRSTASFGKRIEYCIAGLMLKEGLDVYFPMLDDDAIDAVVKKPDGRFVEVQIKARSKRVVFGDAALFAALRQCILRKAFVGELAGRSDIVLGEGGV